MKITKTELRQMVKEALLSEQTRDDEVVEIVFDINAHQPSIQRVVIALSNIFISGKLARTDKTITVENVFLSELLGLSQRIEKKSYGTYFHISPSVGALKIKQVVSNGKTIENPSLDDIQKLAMARKPSRSYSNKSKRNIISQDYDNSVKFEQLIHNMVKEALLSEQKNPSQGGVFVVVFAGRGHNESNFEVLGIYPSLADAQANSSSSVDIFKAAFGQPIKKWKRIGPGGF